MSGNESQQVNAIDVLLQNADGDVLLPYTGYNLDNMADVDLSNLSNTGQAILDNLASINLSNLSSAGQAILDKKVEVEALLQQNGYAKFTWKDDNGISKKLIIQWGQRTFTSKTINANSTTTESCSFPTAFSSFGNIVLPAYVYYWFNVVPSDRTTNNFKVIFYNATSTAHSLDGYHYIAIGY